MPKNSITTNESKAQDVANGLDDENLLNFTEVCEEVANDLTRGIAQCRKSTILMRKEQSDLAKQRVDLSDMLDLAQRDFEIAVKHTKNLIQKEKEKKQAL